jgi:predicted RNase H-like nuclease (RuvC/YqgF family)
MTLEAFLNPAFLLSAFAGLITLVAWFVRLESKITNLQTENSNLKQRVQKLESDLESHRQNQDIHFNLRISTQVEQGNERRFQTIERQLTEINHKLDRMAEK